MSKVGVLSLQGAFRLHADVYREAFRTVARGLYHNRSGIALEAPFTEFTRPAPHNPKLTPGFAGKLIYTTVRFTEWGSEGGDAKVLLAGSKGPIESCGWYQDAGDWDSYYTHLRVAQELLLAYEMAPAHFTRWIRTRCLNSFATTQNPKQKSRRQKKSLSTLAPGNSSSVQ